MRIADIKVHSFRIPFKESVSVAGKCLHHREGFVLELVDERQRQFFGEVSPLPGLDPVPLSQCQEQLCRLKNYLVGHLLLPEQFDLKKPLLGLFPVLDDSPLDPLDANVRFGLESALMQLVLSRDPYRQLEAEGNLEIPVNGLFIPSENSDRIRPQLNSLRFSGFETVKVKIGRIAPEIEVEQIHQLVDFFDGAVTLRLDGNRSLSFEGYKQFYQRLNSLPVEYVEEPLPPGGLRDALTVPWPLALDESLGDFLEGPVPDVSNLPGQVRHIIVKPAAMQGIYGLSLLLASAVEHGIQVVLSSAFNTGIGLSLLGLVSRLSPQNHDTSHGLDTLKYLSGDLLSEPLSITRGKLGLPVSLFIGETELNSRFLGEVAPC